MERTLVLLKPDTVQRRLVGEIVRRFEAKGLRLCGMKMMKLSEEQARSNYAEHAGKTFYEPLVRFMTSSPIVALALEGKNAAEVVRKMVGPTFGPEAPGGTIRGDYGMSNRFNLVHASDSAKSAQRELALYFKMEEMFEGIGACDVEWVYDLSDGGVV
jgi:nucleoside-diphosphate kinase